MPKLLLNRDREEECLSVIICAAMCVILPLNGSILTEGSSGMFLG